MIYVEKAKGIPMYEQIYEKLVDEILSGDLKAGEMLPPTRVLAEELSVSRNTVDRAYQQLTAEGYIQAKPRSGFVVSSIPLDFTSGEKEAAGTERGKGDRETIQKSAAIKYDFSYGSMDNKVFPYKQWRKSLNDMLGQMEMADVMRYPDKMGELSLRREISRYLKSARDVECDPYQIVVTSGQQHSMEMIANMFEDGRKRFIMEEPGYDGIRKVFENHGYEIRPVPVEEDGVALAPLSSMDSALLYVTPSHQFPTGAVTSIAKRRQLLQWAEDTDSYVIEDDYDSELRYATRPIPAMQALDICGRTIYTGTFSKSLAPVMRTAYIILPPGLVERFMRYYQRYNSQVNTLHQLALADFIASGNYQRHVNRLRTTYRKKLNVLMEAADRVLGDKVKITGGDAGIHILMRVESRLSLDELLERAESTGIRLYDTRALYVQQENCPANELLLGFPTVPEEALEPIMKKLAEVWELDSGGRRD